MCLFVGMKDGGEGCFVPWVRVCWRTWGPLIPDMRWFLLCSWQKQLAELLNSLLKSSTHQMLAYLGSGSQTNPASAQSCHHQCFGRKVTSHKYHWILAMTPFLLGFVSWIHHPWSKWLKQFLSLFPLCLHLIQAEQSFRRWQEREGPHLFIQQTCIILTLWKAVCQPLGHGDEQSNGVVDKKACVNTSSKLSTVPTTSCISFHASCFFCKC